MHFLLLLKPGCSLPKEGWRKESGETKSVGERREEERITAMKYPSLSKKKKCLNPFIFPTGWMWKDTPSEEKCGRVEGTGDELSLWLEATHCEGCRKASSATRACPCPSGLGAGVSGPLCYMGHQLPLLLFLAQIKKKKKKKSQGNKGGFCSKRNLLSTLPITAQDILRGLSAWSLAQCLKNTSISVEYL